MFSFIIIHSEQGTKGHSYNEMHGCHIAEATFFNYPVLLARMLVVLLQTILCPMTYLQSSQKNWEDLHPLASPMQG